MRLQNIFHAVVTMCTPGGLTPISYTRSSEIKAAFHGSTENCNIIFKLNNTNGSPPVFFYKLSLRSDTMPVTRLWHEYTNRTRGVFLVATTNGTHSHIHYDQKQPHRLVPFLSIVSLVDPHLCCRSQRTFHTLRCGHLWNVHETSLY